MIQRIQTLYLLVVAALLAVTIFTPMAYFSIGGEEYTLTAFAVRNAEGAAVQPTLYMGILLAMAGILPLIVIFLYKHRMLQLRLCIVEIVLLVGSAVMTGIYYYLSVRFFSQTDLVAKGVHAGIVLPLVAIVFAVLAIRGIFKDEMLVLSLNRIR